MNVLVADDSLVSSRLLEKTLTDWGFRVFTASDGVKAWDLLQREDIRIAVLDWMMPFINGIDLCKKVRRNAKNRYTYIILLTSRAQREDTIKGLLAGADDYVIKPFDSMEMKARLQTGKRIIKLETKLLKTQRRLHELATKDSLTKVSNRDAILQVLDEEIDRCQREKQPLSTIILDIDDFKKINDTFGHQAGDKVLIEVTSRLKKRLRRYDKIGRYGGDELLVVLPNCNHSQLAKISRRLCDAVNAQKVMTSKGALPLTNSLGGYTCRTPAKIGPDQLIIKSDVALYEAKRKGRNQYALSQ